MVTRAPLSSRRSRSAGMAADFVGLAGDRLLTQDQPPPRSPGAHHVQRLAAFRARMGAPRRLAVDRQDVGFALAQAFDPPGKARLKKLGIERVDDVVERIVRRQPAFKRVEPPQKVETQFAPHPDFDKIIHPAKAGAEHQKQNLPQRINHPPALARILERRKIIQKAFRRGCRGHQELRFVEAPQNHISPIAALSVNPRRLPCEGRKEGRAPLIIGVV